MTRGGADRWLLAAALAALAGLYGVWLARGEHLVAALVVFVAPPALLLAGVLAGRARARFWAGVFGLLWFSHGVMEAWSAPATRGYAWTAIALALAIVGAASAPGLRARFGGRGRRGGDRA